MMMMMVSYIHIHDDDDVHTNTYIHSYINACMIMIMIMMMDEGELTISFEACCGEYSDRDRQRFVLGLTGLALSKPNQLSLNRFGVLKPKLNQTKPIPKLAYGHGLPTALPP